MPDVALPWSSDFTLTDAGDVAVVDDIDLSNQRVIRRLLTAPQAYLWHPGYGAGLGAYVGRPVPASQVVKAIMRQIFRESTVARSPIPKVSVVQGFGTVSPTLRYVVNSAGGPVTLIFDVTNPNDLTGQ